MTKYKHFYFKFGGGNSLFAKHFDEQKQLYIGDDIDLAIYFTEADAEEFKKLNNQPDLSQDGIKQMSSFIEAVEKYHETSVFWVFYKAKIYAIQSKSNEIFSVYGKLSSANDLPNKVPKLAKCRVLSIFDPNEQEIPEFFATTQASQEYNRKTIVEFKKKPIVDVCNHLLQETDKKLPINKSDLFNYLSPLQFETLIFLIFYNKHEDIFCKTYRGGTIKDIDLIVDIPKNVFPNMEGVNKIQIKMYDYTKNIGEGITLIHLGKSEIDKNTYGKDWIEKEIALAPRLQKWLQKSLDFFEY